MTLNCYKAFKLFLFFISLCSFLLLSPNPASAQRKNVSGQEMGVLTFYRLTGLTPDFKSWVEATKEYRTKQMFDAADADNYLQEELLRLQYALGTIDLNNNYMNMKTDVLASLVTSEGKHYLMLQFPGKDNNRLYFPYNVHTIWVAVIMKNIEKFTTIPLTSEEATRIQSYVPEGINDKPLKLEIVYRAISAQSEPVAMDSEQQYIMLGEIAQWTLLMEDFHQSHNKVIWEFMDPSYRTPNENELINMLEGR